MSVTIGIFIHNEIPLLKRTLRSLRENTEYPHTIVLVDDGSTKKANVFLRSLQNVTLITNRKRMGYPHCANLVIEYSNTPYILFLDSATYVTKSWLSRLIESLEVDPAHGIAGPSTSLAWGEQRIVSNLDWSEEQIQQFDKTLQKRYGKQSKSLDTLHNVSGFCYCFKRQIVDQIGYFDEAYQLGQCDDIDYNTRAFQAGYKALWVCGVYVHRYPMQRFGQHAETLLESNKRIYQNKFCARHMKNQQLDYCDHCLGEECEFFTKPPNPKKVFRYPQCVAITYHTERDEAITRSHREKYPLVSCIMPTSDRPLFVPQAINYFLRQDYSNRELVIIDDGTHAVSNLIPEDPRIHYKQLSGKHSIGAKRNLACEVARGRIIVLWDDDDWYAAHRISYQVKSLLTGKADVTGLTNGLLLSLPNRQFWTCTSRLHARMFLQGIIGGSLTFWKRLWNHRAQFPDSSLAEDAAFLQLLIRQGARLERLTNKNTFIYVRHNTNTWQFTPGNFLDNTSWRPVKPPPFIPEQDIEFYGIGSQKNIELRQGI